MSEGRVIRPSSSPAPPVASMPDNDDLLREFFLRLPPRPSSLIRASLVCRRWRRLLSDPQFLRRFRAFHHRGPPLLGFFAHRRTDLRFYPTLDPPDRVPSPRLSLPQPRAEVWSFIGCRHGLALLLNWPRMELTVFEPVSGGQRRVAVPRALFSNDELGPKRIQSGALFRDAGHAGRAPLEAFKVVLLRNDDWRNVGDHHVCASLYDSATGVWGDLVSTSVKAALIMGQPSILVGNSLYCTLRCCIIDDEIPEAGGGEILEFDLDEGTLSAIEQPVAEGDDEGYSFQILRMEDGGLGLAISSARSLQVWERMADSSGVARWTLQKTIEMDKLLSLRPPTDKSWLQVLGYDEDGHVIVVTIDYQVFMIELKSMQFKKLFQREGLGICHPYRSFYATGRAIGSGDGTLSNAGDCCL